MPEPIITECPIHCGYATEGSQRENDARLAEHYPECVAEHQLAAESEIGAVYIDHQSGDIYRITDVSRDWHLPSAPRILTRYTRMRTSGAISIPRREDIPEDVALIWSPTS